MQWRGCPTPCDLLALRVSAVLGMVCVSVAPLMAQEACADGRIASVTINNQSVFDGGEAADGRRFSWAYRLANNLHMRTREEVVERELLFEAGDCHDVDRLRDSERLLRGFGFLADATIYGIRQPGGDVQVVVETQDEWSTRVEPRLGSGSMGLRGVRLVEDNLLGTGRHLSFFYDDDVDRVYGVTYASPHIFGSRWNLGAQFARTDAGHSYYGSVTYPFVGETGRFAFRQLASRDERNFEILMPDAPATLARVRVPVRREEAEIGAAFRWGRERFKHTMLGASMALERVEFPGQATFLEPDGQRGPAVQELAGQWNPVSSVRFTMLTGQSNVYYVRRRGLDTLDGTEDVRLGVEAEASLGPTIPQLSTDHDVAVGLGFFAAGEPIPQLIAGMRFSFEARRSYEALPDLPEWNDVLAEIGGWAYFRPSVESRHLLVATVSGIGGWHSRIPFQLTLGGDAGLRGYPRHVDPGGRRLVGSLEYRAKPAWPFPDLFDFGTVAFVDVGKIWRGHAPFGTDSPVRAAAGFGIRAAFPPGSRQTFRLDVGFPVESGSSLRNAVLTVGVGQAIGRHVIRRDPQILRSTRYGLTNTDFLQP